MTTNPYTDLNSFIDVPENSDFSMLNLPFGVFQPNALSKPRVGIAIGEYILDLSVLESAGFFEDVFDSPSYIFTKPTLNTFLAKGRESCSAVRSIVSNLLRADEPALRDKEDIKAQAFVNQSDARMLLPVDIPNYTDFYSSREHAINVGTIFRSKENALLPNWSELPIAYHGRASSIVLSGTDIIRPQGQILGSENQRPQFLPTQFLDFELELGFIVGPGTKLGSRISIADAREHIFGVVLVNDWSARDIQRWEYQPLGPFQSKSFATSISPWIVTLDALEPLICAGPDQHPQPLPYIQRIADFTFDINLQIQIQTKNMDSPEIISTTNSKNLYWDILQQVTHHTANGCNLRTGDLLATGTISGRDKNSDGSMLELAWNKTQPIKLSSGETRTDLEDGDRISFAGWNKINDHRIGFGSLTGKILPFLP
jgi:fumarylacetoacetase